MAAERALGNTPEDVSARKVGYDIASFDPGTRSHRFIEVKGRVDGADTVMITRQEIITSLHEPEKFILAIVEVSEAVSRASPAMSEARSTNATRPSTRTPSSST